mmetsp:Transcript_3961/g.11277  ORF Transcript_3961/g.11277 Transcript_3961/m.11277 type:complete len:325 (+) Transcript_3961:648-1622(+)
MPVWPPTTGVSTWMWDLLVRLDPDRFRCVRFGVSTVLAITEATAPVVSAGFCDRSMEVHAAVKATSEMPLISCSCGHVERTLYPQPPTPVSLAQSLETLAGRHSLRTPAPQSRTLHPRRPTASGPPLRPLARSSAMSRQPVPTWRCWSVGCPLILRPRAWPAAAPLSQKLRRFSVSSFLQPATTAPSWSYRSTTCSESHARAWLARLISLSSGWGCRRSMSSRNAAPPVARNGGPERPMEVGLKKWSGFSNFRASPSRPPARSCCSGTPQTSTRFSFPSTAAEIMRPALRLRKFPLRSTLFIVGCPLTTSSTASSPARSCRCES